MLKMLHIFFEGGIVAWIYSLGPIFFIILPFGWLLFASDDKITLRRLQAADSLTLETHYPSIF